MSRVPRSQEHLKTAFTAEAGSAARFRAQADRAEREGMPALAARWRELAAAKDVLAVRLLEAAGKVPAPDIAVRDAIAEERYENDVLYPKMIDEVREEAARTLRQAVSDQRAHLAELDGLRRELQAAPGDLEPAAAAPESN